MNVKEKKRIKDEKEDYEVDVGRKEKLRCKDVSDK
jgi:hypothetical protein